SKRMRKLRRLGPYLIFAREIEEYLASHASDPAGLSFTQKIVGLVETDIGLGIVVQAAKNRQEQLAPTIDRLIQENCFGETEQMALQIFIEKFLASPVVVSDLHWRNLVYAFTPENGDHFVMIDGLGSSNVFPIKSWFPSINRRSKAARV